STFFVDDALCQLTSIWSMAYVSACFWGAAFEVDALPLEPHELRAAAQTRPTTMTPAILPALVTHRLLSLADPCRARLGSRQSPESGMLGRPGQPESPFRSSLRRRALSTADWPTACRLAS